jgi:hypothetical protein
MTFGLWALRSEHGSNADIHSHRISTGVIGAVFVVSAVITVLMLGLWGSAIK